MAAPNLVNVTTILGKTTGAALDTTTTTSLLANSSSSGKVYKINSIIVAKTGPYAVRAVAATAPAAVPAGEN